MNELIRKELDEAVIGNIYKESFYDSGKTYNDYSADCALCGIERGIWLSKKDGMRCGSFLKRCGWKKEIVSKKWVCDLCISKIAT